MPFGVPDFVTDGVDAVCCDWWTEGCGLDGCFGMTADCLEVINPAMEMVGNAIWIFGSPLAFPLIFCFPSDPHTHESSGYDISMLQAPLRRPFVCCFSAVCLPCGQWYVRRRVLDNDMSKYKLWQGYHDGPHCCARQCPQSGFIVIEAGTYGEEQCPDAFLCAEILVLGGPFSLCCAFDVSRRYQREERGLNLDPTEARQQKCIGFFSGIMSKCFQLGACMYCCSCCVGICANDSEGAQECAGEGGRAARACCRIAHIIWRGIIWTRVIGMGCMTTQMIHEADVDWDGNGKKGQHPPQGARMERGNDTDDEPEGIEFDQMKMPWSKALDDRPQSSAPDNTRMRR